MPLDLKALDRTEGPGVRYSHIPQMRLLKERKAAGLTQEDLARMADVTQSYISKLERGERVTPRFDILDRIARVLRRYGRRVEVGQIAPRPQPLLIKGARAPKRKSA